MDNIIDNVSNRLSSLRITNNGNSTYNIYITLHDISDSNKVYSSSNGSLSKSRCYFRWLDNPEALDILLRIYPIDNSRGKKLTIYMLEDYCRSGKCNEGGYRDHSFSIGSIRSAYNKYSRK